MRRGNIKVLVFYIKDPAKRNKSLHGHALVVASSLVMYVIIVTAALPNLERTECEPQQHRVCAAAGTQTFEIVTMRRMRSTATLTMPEGAGCEAHA